MKKFKAKVTSDFKNSTKRKEFDSEIFVAKYNNGNYYRVFIDREDDRRVVIIMEEAEMEALIKSLGEFKK